MKKTLYPLGGLIASFSFLLIPLVSHAAIIGASDFAPGTSLIFLQGSGGFGYEGNTFSLPKINGTLRSVTFAASLSGWNAAVSAYQGTPTQLKLTITCVGGPNTSETWDVTPFGVPVNNADVPQGKILPPVLVQLPFSTSNQFTYTGQTCIGQIDAAGTSAKLAATYVNSASSTQMFIIFDDSAGGGQLSPNPYFSVGVSTSSVAAFCDSSFSTSTGLLESVGATIVNGLCRVSAFLFVPDQGVLSNYSLLGSTTRQKIPFSYAYQVSDQINALSATSTENLPTYTADMHSIGLGSTSPIGNVLPTLSFLSQSTIGTYLPAGIHDALFLLARAAIWFTVALMIYHRIIPHKAKV